MIISALSTYLKDDKELPDIVKYYPFISFMEENGSVKKDVMNKYFVMKTKEVDNRVNEEIK